jgi:hypothetical protein
MAGEGGFEPPIPVPKTGALPLGHSPISYSDWPILWPCIRGFVSQRVSLRRQNLSDPLGHPIEFSRLSHVDFRLFRPTSDALHRLKRLSVPQSGFDH